MSHFFTSCWLMVHWNDLRITGFLDPTFISDCADPLTTYNLGLRYFPNNYQPTTYHSTAPHPLGGGTPGAIGVVTFWKV